MKLFFKIGLTSALALASLSTAFGSSTVIDGMNRFQFYPDRITSVALSPGRTLPNSYSAFEAFVFEAFGPGSILQQGGPEEDCTGKDRGCYHRSSDPYNNAQKTIYKYPDIWADSFDLQVVILGDYQDKAKVFLSFHKAIRFSDDESEQEQLTSALRQKLITTSKHQVAMIYLNGRSTLDAADEAFRFISSKDVRIFDNQCAFYGTPEEFIRRNQCMN